MPMGFSMGTPPAQTTEKEEQVQPVLTDSPEQVSAMPSDLVQGVFQRLAQSGSEAPPPLSPLKQMIPFVGPMHQAKRGKAISGVAQASNAVLDELINMGLDVEQARSITLLQTARRLDQLGFINEAGQLRAEGANQLKAWRDTVITRNQKIAETNNTISTQIERDEELEAASETWVKYKKDGSGNIEDWRQVFITDDEVMRSLADQGWVAINGNLAAALAGQLDFASIQPLPQGAQENILAGFNMLNHIRVLRSVSTQVGFNGIIPEGPLRNLAAGFGITSFNNDNFVDAVASRRSVRASIQALIKGIPSNYDASVFEAMIPDPGSPRGENFYNAQLDVLERETRNLISLTLAFHLGTNKHVPQEVVLWANAFGIDPNSVPGLTKEEVDAIKNNSDGNLFQQHEKAVRDASQGATDVNAARQSVMQKVNDALAEQENQ